MYRPDVELTLSLAQVAMLVSLVMNYQENQEELFS